MSATSVFAHDPLCKSVFEGEDSAKSEAEKNWLKVYQTQISPAYKASWKTQSKRYAVYLNEDKRRGRAEFQVLQRLGFDVKDDDLQAPDFQTFLDNYRKILDEKQVPDKDRILPALVLSSGRDSQGKFVVPGVDKFPAESDLRVAGDYVMSQIDIFEQIPKGRYSVYWSGLHDVYHFVQFAMHPNYMKLIRESYSHVRDVQTELQMQAQKSGSSEALERLSALWRRLAFAHEALVLADPKQLEGIQAALKFPGFKAAKSPVLISDVIDYYKNVSLENLMKSAGQLLDQFPGFLNFYAAGMSDRSERQTHLAGFGYSDLLRQMTPNLMPEAADLKGTIHRRLLRESMVYMDDSLLRLLNIYHLSDLSRFDEKFFPAPAVGSEKSPDQRPDQHPDRRPDRRKEHIEKLIRIQMARMEYALWMSATEITVERWIHDTVLTPFDPESSTMKFIKDTMGENSVLYQSFL